MRYGLRTLLIATTVLGIALGWVGNVLVHVRSQRKAVAKISELGGKCAYENLLSDRDSELWVKFLRRVVDDDTFAHVVAVSFEFDEHSEVSDNDLAAIASFPRLQSVDLCGSRLTDNGLRHLESLSQLKRLTLYETRITAIGLSASRIADRLDTLSVGGSTVNDASLEEIGRLANLRYLAVHRAPEFTDAGMAHVANLGQLETLEIYKTSVTDQGLVHLHSLPHLSELTLNSCAISDSGVRQLTGLSALKRLSIQDTSVSDQGLAEISKLHGIEDLNLWSTSITDLGIPQLAKLPRLRRLNVFSTAVTDVGIRELRSLSTLEWLSSGPNVTFDGAKEFRRSVPKCRVDVVDSTNTIHTFGTLNDES